MFALDIISIRLRNIVKQSSVDNVNILSSPAFVMTGFFIYCEYENNNKN